MKIRILSVAVLPLSVLPLWAQPKVYPERWRKFKLLADFGDLVSKRTDK